MQCPSCLLRFTTNDRQPIIEPCGHTICKLCILKLQQCPSCSQPLSSPLNPKINYSLLQILEKDTRIVDKFIKVCLIGSSGVGKTSIIRMLTGKDFSEDVATTVGYDFMFVDRVIGGYTVRFQLWDSAGQQRYRSISPIHYKNAHIILLVYNLCGKASENQMGDWIYETEKHAPEEAQKIIIGNKADLVEGKVFQPLDEAAWQIIKKEKIVRIDTSCRSGTGADQLWSLLQNCFSKRTELQIKTQQKPTPKPQKQPIIKNRQTVRTSLEYQKNKRVIESHQQGCSC